MQTLHLGFRLIVAAIIGTAIYAWFDIAIPPADAMLVGVVAFFIELVVPLMRGPSASSSTIGILSFMLKIALPVLAWPGLVWCMQRYLHAPSSFADPAAAGGAALISLFTLGHENTGPGDRQRNLRITLALVFVFWTSSVWLPAGCAALAGSTVAALCAVGLARFGIVWGTAPRYALNLSAAALVLVLAVQAVFLV